MSKYNSKPITQLIPGAEVLGTDVFPAVDVTDLAQSPSGTTKKYTVNQLQEYLINEFNGDNIPSAKYCTTGNLNANYSNGSAGVGARLVNAGTLGQLTVDGNIAIAGDRILVPYQTNAYENGVYEVTDAGDVGTPWVLTRVSDFDGSILGEILQGMFIYVVFGSINALTCWIVTSDSFPIVGTDDIEFQKQTNPVAEAWAVVTTNTQIAVNTGYTAKAAVTFTLPVLSAPGEWFEINNGGYATSIAQNAGQSIYFSGIGATTPGVTGSLDMVDLNSALRIRCVSANTDFEVVSAVGATFTLN